MEERQSFLLRLVKPEDGLGLAERSGRTERYERGGD